MFSDLIMLNCKDFKRNSKDTELSTDSFQQDWIPNTDRLLIQQKKISQLASNCMKALGDLVSRHSEKTLLSTRKKITGSEAKSSIARFLECEKSLRQRTEKSSDAQIELLGLIDNLFQHIPAVQIRTCGFYSLVNQLLNQAETNQNHILPLRLAHNLLSNSDRINIVVTPCSDMDPAKFTGALIKAAEALLEHPEQHSQSISSPAQIFKRSFDELLQALKENLEQLRQKQSPSSAWHALGEKTALTALFKKFDASWEIFVKTYLTERCHQLAAHSPSTIESAVTLMNLRRTSINATATGNK